MEYRCRPAHDAQPIVRAMYDAHRQLRVLRVPLRDVTEVRHRVLWNDPDGVARHQFGELRIALDGLARLDRERAPRMPGHDDAHAPVERKTVAHRARRI